MGAEKAAVPHSIQYLDLHASDATADDRLRQRCVDAHGMAHCVDPTVNSGASLAWATAHSPKTHSKYR